MISKNRQEPVANLFTDLDLNFTANPLTRDISVKKDSEAVKRSIRNLVLSELYERPFQPELNGGIRNLLFENLGSVQIVTLQNRLRELITNFEPRVTQIGVEIKQLADVNSLVINIRFKVSSIAEIQELDIQLQRVR
jgi:phage baseplate assembly protein W